jgi:ATP-binding cassette, subfamily B, bacterial PglK
MFRSIILFLTLLTPHQQKRLFILQILVVLMALAEILGVASIGPFMALVGDINILSGDNPLSELYKSSGLTKPYDFVFWVGLAVLFFLTVGALISMFTIWRLSLFAQKTGTEIGDRLYKHYMYQPWLFHASESSAQLTKQIATETERVTANIITPLMQMNARLVMALFMSAAIFIYHPKIMICGMAVFAFAYLLLYNLIKLKLTRNGQIISEATFHRFKLMSEGFGGIKEVLLLGRQREFVKRFESSGKKLANSLGSTMGLSQVPRYFMELIGFGTVIFLVIYLIKDFKGDLGSVLPVLSVYSLAGLKLLPVFQTTYGSLAQIRGSLSAFEAIKEGLQASQEVSSYEINPTAKTQLLLANNKIELKGIEFTYPGKKKPALTRFNMKIPIHKVIGLVGSSGSGKSTAIDLFLGLITPDTGNLLLDNKPLSSSQVRAWQNSLGYVPQNIFLADSSIMENIAFGLPLDTIDQERIQRVIKLVQLDELIQQLPKGLNTSVGERGVQLSGGQRQRIGIARALYNDAQILILDEATSALDGISEKLIMDTIHEFSGEKTIVIIAHRFSTVQKCSLIYFMEGGEIVDQGTYDDLMARNETFKKMAIQV